MLMRFISRNAAVWAVALSFLLSMSARAERPQAAIYGMLPTTSNQNFWIDNLQQGWQESKRRGLPMLVFITSDRCVYCDAMKRDTWGDQMVLERLRREFVPIRLHRDRDSGVLSRIRVPAFPTTLLATPQGKVVSHRVGYQPAPEIHRLLSEARQATQAIRR